MLIVVRLQKEHSLSSCSRRTHPPVLTLTTNRPAQIASVLDGSIENLLHAVHVRREARHDDPLLRRGEDPVERFGCSHGVVLLPQPPG